MAAAVIFVLTYLAVAAGRFPGLSLDRPAAAVLGAVLMVACGVLTPAEAGAAVNGDTIGLLLGMMILTQYLREAAFFRWAAWRVIRAARTPRTLLWGLVLDGSRDYQPQQSRPRCRETRVHDVSREDVVGAPDRIRTCDLRLRRPTLYPLSYRRAASNDTRCAWLDLRPLVRSVSRIRDRWPQRS